MAQTKKSQKSRKRSSGSSKNSSSSSRSRNGRSASQKPEKYRFAQNVDGEETVAERNHPRLRGGGPQGPAVWIPTSSSTCRWSRSTRSISSSTTCRAHVALQAKVLELVNLNVGVDVQLGKVKLDIKGVEAQAVLKVRLDQ